MSNALILSYLHSRVANALKIDCKRRESHSGLADCPGRRCTGPRPGARRKHPQARPGCGPPAGAREPEEPRHAAGPRDWRRLRPGAPRARGASCDCKRAPRAALQMARGVHIELAGSSPRWVEFITSTPLLPPRSFFAHARSPGRRIVVCRVLSSSPVTSPRRRVPGARVRGVRGADRPLPFPRRLTSACCWDLGACDLLTSD